MATIKSFTSLEQSKVLAKILPIESADMCYNDGELRIGYAPLAKERDDYFPCWSLAALLYALPFPQLSKDNLGSGRIGWMVSAYPDNCRYDSCWHDNPIDACYELTLKLHELKLL